MNSHTRIFLFTILDVIIKHSNYVKINSVDPLYLFLNKVVEHLEEINERKCKKRYISS